MSSEEKLEKKLTMQVSVQIIKLISSGLYRSPASAIKELISNSFDADAHNVNIEFHFSYDKSGNLFLDYIRIVDDGSGMDLKTLEYIFTHIGGSSKSTKEEKTPGGRDIIGRLGIGMLSVAATCRSFIVRTKKKNEEREYSASISLSFFDDLLQLTRTMDKFSIGNVALTSRSVTGFEQYTIIEIHDFRPPFLSNILERVDDSYFFQTILTLNSKRPVEEQYQEYFEGYLEKLSFEEKLLVTPVLDQIIATVGLMSPVEYLVNGPVRSKITIGDGSVRDIPGTGEDNYLYIKEKLRKLDFTVTAQLDVDYQGEGSRNTRNKFKIFKPLLYPSKRDIEEKGIDKLDPYVYVLEPKDTVIENEPGEVVDTQIRGYVYHQNARILPHEYRGMLFRVYNVAIGDYFKDELRLYSEDPVVLHQTMVEVYLDKGFQTIVNLDRESLFEGARTYQYLRAFLENLFMGKVPERPPIKVPETPQKTQSEKSESNAKEETEERKTVIVSTNEASANRDIIFFDSLTALLPERKGIIRDIKVRSASKRKQRMKKKDPTESIREVACEKLGTEDVGIEYTATLDDYGLISFKENNEEATISLPRFEGSRSKTWESIFTAAAVWGPKEAENRIEFMRVLYSIYITSEGK
ncbi:MAG: ATP-binding protein [Thermoplasmatales archaeon]|nr:ATP-binding protein [Thermoplasmatales archaeon]